MRIDTRRTIHLGVNFFLAPPPDTAGSKFLDFQRSLAEERIEFSQVARVGRQIRLIREGAVRLQVQLGPGGEGATQAPIGQLLIIAAADPQSSSVDAGVGTRVFTEEAEAICDAFEQTWEERRQVVARDSAIHLLYDAGETHAFQYLWENRLHQSSDSLEIFGSVLGGGLRFVTAPAPEDDPVTIEVKIESFLRNPSKLYVEAVMQWPKPRSEMNLNSTELINETERLISEKVEPFMTTQGESG